MMKRQSLRKTRGKAPGRKNTSLGDRSLLRPPPFIPTLSLPHKFRFVNGANSGNFSISRGNLLNLFVVATSAVTTARLVEGIRLKRVQIWANPSALGTAPTTIQLEWLGENSPSTIVSSSTMGIQPGYVSARPPPSSSNRWWSMSGNQESDPLFSMVVPVDCVIDVDTEVRLVEQESPTAGDVPAGATLGQVYGDYLDGLASGKLAPIGLATLP